MYNFWQYLHHLTFCPACLQWLSIQTATVISHLLTPVLYLYDLTHSLVDQLCWQVWKIRCNTEPIVAMGLLHRFAAKPSMLPAFNTVLCSGFCMYWQMCINCMVLATMHYTKRIVCGRWVGHRWWRLILSFNWNVRWQRTGSTATQNTVSMSSLATASSSRPRFVSASCSMVKTCSCWSGFRARICCTIFCGLTALYSTE